MAYTIELGTKHLEPVRLEFMQGSVSDSITFVLEGYTIPSSPAIKLMLKDPHGLVFRSDTITPHGDLNGFVFTADEDLFLTPGLYVGAFQILDNDEEDPEAYFSFPVIFTVYKNPNYQYLKFITESRVLAAGATETINTGGMALALGQTAFLQIAGGTFALSQSGSVEIADGVVITYSATSDVTISITNNGNAPIMIPEVTVDAYVMATTARNDITEDLPEMVAVTIQGDMTDGVGSMASGDTYETAALPRDSDPYANVTLEGFSQDPVTGDWTPTLIYGFPADGTVKTVSQRNYKGYYDKATRTVKITATGSCSALNFEKVAIRSIYYEEA